MCCKSGFRAYTWPSWAHVHTCLFWLFASLLFRFVLSTLTSNWEYFHSLPFDALRITHRNQNIMPLWNKNKWAADYHISYKVRAGLECLTAFITDVPDMTQLCTAWAKPVLHLLTTIAIVFNHSRTTLPKVVVRNLISPMIRYGCLVACPCSNIYCTWRLPFECFKTCLIIVLMLLISLAFDLLPLPSLISQGDRSSSLQSCVGYIYLSHLRAVGGFASLVRTSLFAFLQRMKDANRPDTQLLEWHCIWTPTHQTTRNVISALAPNTWTQSNTYGWIALVSRPKLAWKTQSAYRRILVVER